MRQLNLDGLLALTPIDEIAVKFDVDEVMARRAVKQTLSSLFGGMVVNLNEMTRTSAHEQFERAVAQHAPAEDRIPLDSIDVEDGQKIVDHILGNRRETVDDMLSAQADNTEVAVWIPELLPILAPIVMRFLAGCRVDDVESGRSPDTGRVLGDVFEELTGTSRQPGGALGSLFGGWFSSRR